MSTTNVSSEHLNGLISCFDLIAFWEVEQLYYIGYIQVLKILLVSVAELKGLTVGWSQFWKTGFLGTRSRYLFLFRIIKAQSAVFELSS